MRVAGSGALGERISSTDRDWAQKNPCTGVFLAFDLAAPQTPKPSSSEKRQMPSALLGVGLSCTLVLWPCIEASASSTQGEHSNSRASESFSPEVSNTMPTIMKRMQAM
mmetsp:Transcript_18537/g.43581  ORF Transcript_18537/g.43581 Transcript_18537/m.43581 type:complete len:109 (-) Transcript_18537:921-1247(-)